MTTALAGRRVLVTRPAADAANLCGLLRDHGATPVLVPAISIQGMATAAMIAGALDWLGRGGDRWLAITSRNAARVLLDTIDSGALLGISVAAVGDGSASSLQERGVSVDLVADDESAEGLADALIAAGVGEGRVWLPQAQTARPVLAVRLRSAGADVVVTRLYRTVVAPGLRAGLRDAIIGGLDAATFFSPSAVRHVLAASAGWAQSLPAICVGETTAAAARLAGIERVETARSPGALACIDALTVALSR